MSGYQSLHDLIANHIGGFVTTTEITNLTDEIYNEWMPDEAEAVNDAKRQAVKQRAQLVKTRTDLEQAQMTANAENRAGA